MISPKVSNFLHGLTFQKTLINVRNFSSTGTLDRRIALRNMRWNKNMPRSGKYNPLLYLTDYKTGKIKRIEQWQLNPEQHRTVPIDKELVHEFGIDPTHVDKTAYGGNEALAQRILRDESKSLIEMWLKSYPVCVSCVSYNHS